MDDPFVVKPITYAVSLTTQPSGPPPQVQVSRSGVRRFQLLVKPGRSEEGVTAAPNGIGASTGDHPASSAPDPYEP